MKLLLPSLLAGSIFLLLLHRLTYRERDEIFTRLFMRVFFVFLLALLSLTLFNQIYSIPHQVLGDTLFTPGSLITRSILLPGSYFIRRMIEPSALLFLFCIGIYGHSFVKNSSKRLLTFGLSTGMMTLSIEAYLLSSQPFISPEPLHIPHTSYFWVLSLIGIISAFFTETLLSSSFRLVHKKKILNPCIIIPACIFLIGFGYGCFSVLSKTPKLKNIMAHYYVWFPENWKAGYAGRKNNENYPRPFPNEYNSDDPKIITQHITRMQEAGISHVLIDWWPRKPGLKNRAVIAAEFLNSHSDIQFAAHLETLEISKDESKKIISMGEQETATLATFIEHMIKRLGSYPNYFRIDGKVVVFLYASRHLIGDVPSAIKYVRNYIKERLGVELYIIGDEVFYNVPDSKTGNLLPPYIPSWERIRAFDAITLYNPYDPHLDYSQGDEGVLELVQETEKLVYHYRSIAETAGIPFIPVVIPGYDDRVVRPDNNSTPVLTKDTRGTLLLELLHESNKRALGRSFPDSLIVTSWNEWNEGTQIEPGVLSSSDSPDTTTLKTLRNFLQ